MKTTLLIASVFCFFVVGNSFGMELKWWPSDFNGDDNGATYTVAQVSNITFYNSSYMFHFKCTGANFGTNQGYFIFAADSLESAKSALAVMLTAKTSGLGVIVNVNVSNSGGNYVNCVMIKGN